jgi:hypothetical protein
VFCIKIPTLKGLIDRRILINYQVNKDVLAAYLPAPFQPQLVNGKGIAGICLIRLKQVRQKGLPSQWGITSENGAHCIAVEWQENGAQKTGVYIPRRDTSNRLNAWAGGFIFPGVHHLAQFSVKEGAGQYEVGFVSKDQTKLSIQAQETKYWNPKSIFKSLAQASGFFEKGCIGYSPSKNKYDGLLLKTFKCFKVIKPGFYNYLFTLSFS